jgi:hypothetical protein
MVKLELEAKWPLGRSIGKGKRDDEEAEVQNAPELVSVSMRGAA